MKHRISFSVIVLLAMSLQLSDAQTPWKRAAKKLSQNSLETEQIDVTGEATQPEQPRVTAGDVQNFQSTQPPMQSKINLGNEFEETGKIKNLFEDPEVKRLLGDNPRFVYQGQEEPDPMVFPPVRNQAIYNELVVVADQLVEENKLVEAVLALSQIMNLRDSRFLVETGQKINELNARIGVQRAEFAPTVVVAELPDWVRNNTRGVLFVADSPLCLVGDYMLSMGDSIPNYPEVRVASITKEKVTYEVLDEKFVVDVKGYDGGIGGK